MLRVFHQMAQEKEELKRKRDELDGQVRKMEIETKALENTIQLFSDHTSLLWTGLSKVKKSSKYGENSLKTNTAQWLWVSIQ